MMRGLPWRILLLVVFVLVPLMATTGTAQAGDPPNRLDYNGGVVVRNPVIHNLYMDTDWDGHNPAEISRANIDDFTRRLTTSGYLDPARQYGITPPSFDGSDDAGLLCQPPIINGVTDFVEIATWVACMTAPGPDPFIRPTLTGIPVPDDDSLYVVYVPSHTTINDVVIKTCTDFGAYHFFDASFAWHIIGGFLPVLKPQRIPFAVVPIDCTTVGTPPPAPQDGVSILATHEIVETATDPIIVTGWIDNNKLGFNTDILTKGEAADICEDGVGDAGTPPVRLSDGLMVAPYWSNADGRCVPSPPPVTPPPPPPSSHSFILIATGLPATVQQRAQFDGLTVPLPFTGIVDDATTHNFSFPSPVKSANPGTRYVTAEPGGTVNVTTDFSRTATYRTQHLLVVQATPPTAAALDESLTPSAWHDAGSTVQLDTDAMITAGIGARYRFDHWSGGLSSTSPHASITMSGPNSVIANYVSQHLVIVRSQGLGNNNTHVLNGTTVLGVVNDLDPLAVYIDDGPLALNADALVDGANGIQYFFQEFSPTPTETLTAAFATTATYETMAQIIDDALASGALFGPGAAGLANSYRKQFEAVQSNIASDDHAGALQDLRSFISHAQAQDDKHLTPTFARTIQVDALLVWHDQLCKASTAGQIDSATAAASYALYSTLISSVGGVLLPPC